MRLRKTRRILFEIIPFLELKATSRNTNPRTYQLSNVDELKIGIEKLNQLGLFDKQVEKIIGLSFYSSSTDNKTIFIPDQEYKVLIKLVPELKVLSQNIVTAISKAIDKNDQNIISIKIPPPQNFDDLETTSNKLNKIFSQTLSGDSINGGIRIKNFDTGSYWIDIIASSKEIIGIIAGLAWSGVIVYKKFQEGRILEEKARELKISNKALEEIIEKSKEAVNSTADLEANYLYKTFFQGKDNEQVERIKMALKELSDLYTKGAEIHPSLNATDESAESFPDFDKIENVVSKVKRIENKK